MEKLEPALGGGRILYSAVAVLFAINLSLVGLIYGFTSSRITEITIEQRSHLARLAVLETQVSFNEKSLVDLKTQLTRMEAELIAVRIIVGGKFTPNLQGAR